MRLGTVIKGESLRPCVFIDVDHYLDIIDIFDNSAFCESNSDFELNSIVDLIDLPKEFHDEIAAALAEDSSTPSAFRRRIDDVRIVAPVPRPPKNVFCVGRNYLDHIAEDIRSRDVATDLPKVPQFFTKPHTSIVGPGAPIRYDETVTRRLDYEVELAVVIGRGGRDIAVEDALDHVYGYTIVNDVTARDLQRRHDQWFKGKALDTFCPMGPWIVTADEIPDPQALEIVLHVNGEQRQKASTADMIFSVAEIIASLSAGLTLEPGDVIATGTPSGVGYAMEPRNFLSDGDEIRCQVGSIGEMVNRVVAVSSRRREG